MDNKILQERYRDIGPLQTSDGKPSAVMFNGEAYHNSPVSDRPERYLFTINETHHKSFQMGKDEPAMRHFIRSGFTQPQLWLTFTETAYEGHSDIESMTVEQIKAKFDIDL